jgi:hypothetical protein
VYVVQATLPFDDWNRTQVGPELPACEWQAGELLALRARVAILRAHDRFLEHVSYLGLHDGTSAVNSRRPRMSSAMLPFSP